ncbi:hypothetical protein HMPREF9123_2501 [Neisseria bacilliformis ATCC BAA-1200]|uniref:Uncharacterized protein n=1 Tax=Neisseria bacilliformis ATCC BAA-1200 TaxID=888742 RepID=F2BFJ4_9NEIS|nr:hypothetical protein HMPREF9123_2501 [Neisseria bacilliformis ATCC BAA-1200]
MGRRVVTRNERPSEKRFRLRGTVFQTALSYFTARPRAWLRHIHYLNGRGRLKNSFQTAFVHMAANTLGRPGFQLC